MNTCWVLRCIFLCTVALAHLLENEPSQVQENDLALVQSRITQSLLPSQKSKMPIFSEYCAPYMYRGDLNKTNFQWNPNITHGIRWLKVCTDKNGEEVDMELTPDKPDGNVLVFADRKERGGTYIQKTAGSKYTSSTYTLSFYRAGTQIPVKMKSVFLAWCLGLYDVHWFFDTKPSAWFKGWELSVTEEKERLIVRGGKTLYPWVNESIQIPEHVIQTQFSSMMATRYDMVHKISFHFYQPTTWFQVRIYGSAVFGSPTFNSLPPPPAPTPPSPPWPPAPVPTPPSTGPMQNFNVDCEPQMQIDWTGRHRSAWEDFMPNSRAGGVWREVCTDSKGMSIDMHITPETLDHTVELQPGNPVDVQTVRGGHELRMNRQKPTQGIYKTSPKITFSFYKTRTKIPVKVKSVSLHWLYWSQGSIMQFDTVPTAWGKGARLSVTEKKEYLSVTGGQSHGSWVEGEFLPDSAMLTEKQNMLATRWDMVHNITFELKVTQFNWLVAYVYGRGVSASHFKLPTPVPTPAPTHAPTQAPTPAPTPPVCEACDLWLNSPILPTGLLTSGSSFITIPAGAEIVYGNVCTIGSQSYDLKMTMTTPFTTKPSKNGVAGRMYRLNMQQGSNTTLEFTLLKQGTTEQASVKDLYFSVLDVDRNKDKPKETQTVELSGPSEVFTGTEVSETLESGNYKFVSLRGGDATDDPVDIENLTDVALSSTVSLRYADTYTWTVKLSVQGNEPKGRNFFIGGASQLKPSCDAKPR